MHFNKSEDYYKKIKADRQLSANLRDKFKEKKVFFKARPDSRELKDYIDLYEFSSLEEAYHQLMNELCDLTVEAIDLVLPENDETQIFILQEDFQKMNFSIIISRKRIPQNWSILLKLLIPPPLEQHLLLQVPSLSLNLGLTKCSRI